MSKPCSPVSMLLFTAVFLSKDASFRGREGEYLIKCLILITLDLINYRSAAAGGRRTRNSELLSMVSNK